MHAVPDDSTALLLQPMLKRKAEVLEEGEEEEDLGLSEGSPNFVPYHTPVYMSGEQLKLSDIRRLLRRQGVKCELRGGVLHCPRGRLTLYKSLEDGAVVMEGDVSEHYFRLREIVTSQFVVI